MKKESMVQNGSVVAFIGAAVAFCSLVGLGLLFVVLLAKAVFH